MEYAIALVLRPFAALLLLWLVCAPLKRLAWRWIPNGWFKRLLFISWKV